MELDEIYENFGNIYTSKIVPNLAPFESKRRSIEKKYKVTKRLSIVMGIPAIILFCNLNIDIQIENSNFFTENIQSILKISAILLALISGVLYCTAIGIDTKFRNSVKSKILPILLSLFGNFTVKTSSEHNGVSKISLSEIKRLGFFRLAERKEDDDIIEGIYKNLEINITETMLEHQEGSGKHKHTVRDFKGLIVKTKLNKNYKGTTLLAAKNNSRSATKGKLEKVELEDVEFNKMFNIYSDNQVEVRYLLDLSFMEKIKQAKEVFGGSCIHFAIVNDLFYIFINSVKNYFEIAKTEKNIYDIQNFRKVCHEFVSIFKLIEHLNLAKKDCP